MCGGGLIGGGGEGGLFGSFNPWGLVAGLVLNSVMNSGQKAQPAPQMAAPTPPPASQAAKTPEQATFKKGLAGGASNDSTALTGPTGVALDNSQLGKATVLGA